MRRVVLLTLGLVLGVAACGPAVVHIASPYGRYDHTRTRPVLFEALSERAARPLDNTVYTPFRGNRFPSGTSVPPDSARDGLEAARLVPVFPGLPLPLAGDPVGGGTSDRDDLLSFLGAGPLALVGVKPAATPGDLPSMTLARYRTILELLESRTLLGGGRIAITAWADSQKIVWSGRIVDARYHPESLPPGLALRYEDFWFVLFQVPERTEFSRLVVVPIRPRGQDFEGKKP